MKDTEFFSKTNHLPDFFKPLMTVLRLMEKALDEDYNVSTELLRKLSQPLFSWILPMFEQKRSPP